MTQVKSVFQLDFHVLCSGIVEIIAREKNEIYQRGPKLDVDCGYTNFVLASDPSPVLVTASTKPWHETQPVFNTMSVA